MPLKLISLLLNGKSSKPECLNSELPGFLLKMGGTDSVFL